MLAGVAAKRKIWDMAAGVGIRMMESSEYSPVFMTSNLFHINNVKTDCSNHTIKTINITKKKKGDYHYESYFN